MLHKAEGKASPNQATEVAIGSLLETNLPSLTKCRRCGERRLAPAVMAPLGSEYREVFYCPR